MTEPQRRCHRGPRCVRWHKHPDTGARLGAPINAEAGLCDDCARHLEHVLRDLPRAYVALHQALARVSQPGQDVVAGTREPPMPLRGDVEALMAELVHEALCWTESTSEILGIVLDTQESRDARPSIVLQRCCRILANAVPVFLALRDVDHAEPALVDGQAVITTRDGIDGAIVLIDLHHRIRATTGQTRLTHHLPAPCPRCDYLALERDDGSEDVRCTACTKRYTWDEYWKLCGILADREGTAA